MSQHAGPMALTQLGEDEQMFRETVCRFAVEQIAPLVHTMDESQQMDPAIIKKLFQLGLMGIEIPEQYGGAGGTFFNAILAVEEISAVDPSVGVMVWAKVPPKEWPMMIGGLSSSPITSA